MKKSAAAKPVEILLVEDNPGDAYLTLEACREAGVCNKIVVMPDAGKAIAYLRREGEHSHAGLPDIMLVDMHLPGMDGKELIAEIRRHREFDRITVAVMSASHAMETIAMSENTGADCYVLKPVNLEQLSRIIKQKPRFRLAIMDTQV